MAVKRIRIIKGARNIFFDIEKNSKQIKKCTKKIKKTISEKFLANLSSEDVKIL